MAAAPFRQSVARFEATRDPQGAAERAFFGPDAQYSGTTTVRYSAGALEHVCTRLWRGSLPVHERRASAGQGPRSVRGVGLTKRDNY